MNDLRVFIMPSPSLFFVDSMVLHQCHFPDFRNRRLKTEALFFCENFREIGYFMKRYSQKRVKLFQEYRFPGSVMKRFRIEFGIREYEDEMSIQHVGIEYSVCQVYKMVPGAGDIQICVTQGNKYIRKFFQQDNLSEEDLLCIYKTFSNRIIHIAERYQQLQDVFIANSLYRKELREIFGLEIMRITARQIIRLNSRGILREIIEEGRQLVHEKGLINAAE